MPLQRKHRCNYHNFETINMETLSIINEIQRLSFLLQIYKSMCQKDTKSQMEIAAEKLYKDYSNDSKLTIFANLDFENFYETSK